jgi:hypothetical protein
MRLMIVDFPEPLVPRRHKISPFLIYNEKLYKTSTSLKDFLRFFISRIGFSRIGSYDKLLNYSFSTFFLKGF